MTYEDSQTDKLAALGVMAGGIAHEIRNPLAIVSSATQLLLSDRLGPDQRRDCLHRIQQGVQRVAGVIDSLVRFSRPAPDDRCRVDLVALVRDALSLVRPQSAACRAELAVRVPPRLECPGHAGFLRELFANLLLHALNALPAGGGVVELTLSAGEAAVNVRVGAPGAVPSADPLGGPGLGLAICAAVVEHHGGDIRRDREGGGDFVTVTLPL